MCATTNKSLNEWDLGADIAALDQNSLRENPQTTKLREMWKSPKQPLVLMMLGCVLVLNFIKRRALGLPL